MLSDLGAALYSRLELFLRSVQRVEAAKRWSSTLVRIVMTGSSRKTAPHGSAGWVGQGARRQRPPETLLQTVAGRGLREGSSDEAPVCNWNRSRGGRDADEQRSSRICCVCRRRNIPKTRERRWCIRRVSLWKYGSKNPPWMEAKGSACDNVSAEILTHFNVKILELRTLSVWQNLQS